uniref:Uncharacterized protein n=1 Tax=Alexandrium andersonii TaxID=327968 RepID=A0A7S2J9M5_9DINO
MRCLGLCALLTLSAPSACQGFDDVGALLQQRAAVSWPNQTTQPEWYNWSPNATLGRAPEGYMPEVDEEIPNQPKAVRNIVKEFLWQSENEGNWEAMNLTGQEAMRRFILSQASKGKAKQEKTHQAFSVQMNQVKQTLGLGLQQKAQRAFRNTLAQARQMQAIAVGNGHPSPFATEQPVAPSA